MPVIALRTGDHVEWSEPGRCGCGGADPRFVLHGRLDGQINLWSCRLQLSELEQGLLAAGVRSAVYQAVVHDDTLELVIETGTELQAGAIARSVYEACKDVRATHPLAYFTGGAQPRIAVRAVRPGTLPRVERTGKVRAVVDTRKL
jgi:hypothetical protein